VKFLDEVLFLAFFISAWRKNRDWPNDHK